MTANRVPSLTHPAEGVAVMNRRQVALNEISAEAEQVAGLGKVVEGEGRTGQRIVHQPDAATQGPTVRREVVG